MKKIFLCFCPVVISLFLNGFGIAATPGKLPILTPSQLKDKDILAAQRPYYPSASRGMFLKELESYISVWEWLLSNFQNAQAAIKAELETIDTHGPEHYDNWQPEKELELALCPIVFDLDETLVGTLFVKTNLYNEVANFLDAENTRFKAFKPAKEEGMIRFLIMRPGAKKLLKFAKKNLKIFVFTAAAESYSDRLIELLKLELDLDLKLHDIHCFKRPVPSALPENIGPNITSATRLAINAMLAEMEAERFKNLNALKIDSKSAIFIDDNLKHAVFADKNIVPVDAFKLEPITDMRSLNRFKQKLVQDRGLKEIRRKLELFFGRIIEDPITKRKTDYPNHDVRPLVKHLNSTFGANHETIEERISSAQLQYDLTYDIMNLKELIKFWSEKLEENGEIAKPCPA